MILIEFAQFRTFSRWKQISRGGERCDLFRKKMFKQKMFSFDNSSALFPFCRAAKNTFSENFNLIAHSFFNSESFLIFFPLYDVFENFTKTFFFGPLIRGAMSLMCLRCAQIQYCIILWLVKNVFLKANKLKHHAWDIYGNHTPPHWIFHRNLKAFVLFFYSSRLI